MRKPILRTFLLTITSIWCFVTNINAQPIEKKEVYFVVDEMPRFPGGEIELLRFIATNLHLPKFPPDAQICGLLYVRFVIKEDGYVDSVCVVRTVHPLWDAAAIQVVKLMPQWKPGRLKGKAVAVYYTIPIRREMDDD